MMSKLYFAVSLCLITNSINAGVSNSASFYIKNEHNQALNSNRHKPYSAFAGYWLYIESEPFKLDGCYYII